MKASVNINAKDLLVCRFLTEEKRTNEKNNVRANIYKKYFYQYKLYIDYPYADDQLRNKLHRLEEMAGNDMFSKMKLTKI